MTFKSKHTRLLVNERISDWYDRSKKRSQLNADVNLRNLGLFCERTGIDPNEILTLALNGNLTQIFRTYVKQMEKEGRAGSYIVKYKTVLNHWIKFNDIDFKIEDKILDADKYRTVFHEHVPSQVELVSIIRNASKRGRVAIALMAFSGLRPESIGDYNGSDGLRLGDIEGFNAKTLDFDFSPAIITVRDNLSKTRDEYFSLIGDEGLTYIREYLQTRLIDNENLTKDSPLITFRWGKDTKRNMPRTLLITREVRDGMRKASFETMRPYVLRRFFASALSIGETKGYITHEWRQFIMGHKGDMEAHYVNAKGNLNEALKKIVRESYKKCLEFIETGSNPISEEEKERDFKIRLLKLDGFTTKEIEDLHLLDLGDEELLMKRREKLFGATHGSEDFKESAKLDKRRFKKLKNGSRQKMISAYAIDAYLSEGFEFVSMIPGDKAIVKLPELKS